TAKGPGRSTVAASAPAGATPGTRPRPAPASAAIRPAGTRPCGAGGGSGEGGGLGAGARASASGSIMIAIVSAAAVAIDRQSPGRAAPAPPSASPRAPSLDLLQLPRRKSEQVEDRVQSRRRDAGVGRLAQLRLGVERDPEAGAFEHQRVVGAVADRDHLIQQD